MPGGVKWCYRQILLEFFTHAKMFLDIFLRIYVQALYNLQNSKFLSEKDSFGSSLFPYSYEDCTLLVGSAHESSLCVCLEPRQS